MISHKRQAPTPFSLFSPVVICLHLVVFFHHPICLLLSVTPVLFTGSRDVDILVSCWCLSLFVEGTSWWTVRCGGLFIMEVCLWMTHYVGVCGISLEGLFVVWYCCAPPCQVIFYEISSIIWNEIFNMWYIFCCSQWHSFFVIVLQS